MSFHHVFFLKYTAACLAYLRMSYELVFCNSMWFHVSYTLWSYFSPSESYCLGAMNIFLFVLICPNSSSSRTRRHYRKQVSENNYCTDFCIWNFIYLFFNLFTLFIYCFIYLLFQPGRLRFQFAIHIQKSYWNLFQLLSYRLSSKPIVLYAALGGGVGLWTSLMLCMLSFCCTLVNRGCWREMARLDAVEGDCSWLLLVGPRRHPCLHVVSGISPWQHSPLGTGSTFL